MIAQLESIDSAITAAQRPRFSGKAWEWCEQHIELGKSDAYPGDYSTELTPMVRTFYDYAQAWSTRRVVLLVSAQSSKTLCAMNMLAWSVVEDPSTTMWIMASKDNCDEFLRKRLEPHFTNSRKLEHVWPKEREFATQRMIRFDNNIVLLRGSNSRIGLQSDPVRRIFCDERREWKPGAIDLVRKRLRTFDDSIEVSMGTAGIEFDELHRDYLEGSQTTFNWPCLKCGFEQPFRFGRDESPLWQERKRGGVVWESSNTTKPGGVWDYDEVRKTVRYECEQCGHLYQNDDKFKLLENLKPHHANPAALPSSVSLHWNAFYMPWPSCDWSELVVEFLRAKAAMKRADRNPMVAFFTETCGEPWRVPAEKVRQDELLERRGRYKLGEDWKPDGQRIAKLLVVDVQQGYLKFVLRAYAEGGSSRMIDCGTVQTYADLRDYQMRNQVNSQCVFLDCSFNRREVQRECLRYGWNPLEGDEKHDFVLPVPQLDPATKKPVRVRSPWTYKHEDPYTGTSSEGQTAVKVFVWSNPHYMEKLYFYVLRGSAQPWEIPLDAPDDYVREVMAYERESNEDPDGMVTYKWTHRGRRHDFADDELMQLAAADICGITQTETLKQKEQKDE